MFNNTNGFVMPVAPTGYSNGGGMFGNGDEWIGLIIVLALLSGGFGNGFGFGGFGGGNRGGYCEPCATKADLTAQGIVQKLDGITYGISDAAFALSNSINNGFHGVDNAICTLGYQNQQGFNNIGSRIDACCCETQRLLERGFADTNYNLATQACDTRNAIANSTRDIIDNANANNRALLDFLVKDKIETLQAENQSLRLTASQERQNNVLRAAMDANTAEIIRRTGNECPIPAYVVPNPNCCYNAQVSFGNGCACGSY